MESEVIESCATDLGTNVAGGAIDCFKCVSIGGDNEACDDPFHNNGSLEFLQSPCLGGRKGRDGLFPATACIKLAGVYGELRWLNALRIERVTAAGSLLSTV
jgi:hypothetical protein